MAEMRTWTRAGIRGGVGLGGFGAMWLIMVTAVGRIIGVVVVGVVWVVLGRGRILAVVGGAAGLLLGRRRPQSVWWSPRHDVFFLAAERNGRGDVGGAVDELTSDEPWRRSSVLCVGEREKSVSQGERSQQRGQSQIADAVDVWQLE